MNGTVMNTASCVASIINGPNGKMVIVCTTVILLCGINALREFVEGGHTITVTNDNAKLEVA